MFSLGQRCRNYCSLPKEKKVRCGDRDLCAEIFMSFSERHLFVLQTVSFHNLQILSNLHSAVICGAAFVIL